MSVASPCEVCQAAAVQHSCENCGALVCADHFDHPAHVCVACTGEGGGRRI